jgi:hypothetical protein
LCQQRFSIGGFYKPISPQKSINICRIQGLLLMVPL